MYKCSAAVSNLNTVQHVDCFTVQSRDANCRSAVEPVKRAHTSLLLPLLLLQSHVIGPSHVPADLALFTLLTAVLSCNARSDLFRAVPCTCVLCFQNLHNCRPIIRESKALLFQHALTAHLSSDTVSERNTFYFSLACFVFL